MAITYAFAVRYNGESYNGFQKQHHGNTVQNHLERAFSKIANEKINIVCSGRTDAKVHALMQICHFITNAKRSSMAWINGANRYLPFDIKVYDLQIVTNDFSARFSAISRTYNYFLCTDKHVMPWLNGKVTYTYKNLCIKKMNLACQYLLGKQDFKSFQDSACQSKSSVRTIYEAFVKKEKHLIVTVITGNAFLQHMIRNIMGVLVAIASDSNMEPIAMQQILKAKNRTKALINMPPDGLYLTHVAYEDVTFTNPSKPFWCFNE